MRQRIHREGIRIIFISIITAIFLIYMLLLLLSSLLLGLLLSTFVMVMLWWVVYFFRYPVFPVRAEPGEVLSAADGKVVAVEEVELPGFPDGKALLVAVFMSPLDTHLNRYPVHGKVTEVIYEKGKFYPAYLPKSSQLNERNTVKMICEKGNPLWVRQIAGTLARRIINYAREGENVYAGGELGFIKFGSRVDHFLPPNAQIKVKINDKTKTGKTIIATI